MEAYSSDAIPMHLHPPAVALYMDKLAADGLLALHISNRFLEELVVARIVEQAGYAAQVAFLKKDAIDPATEG